VFDDCETKSASVLGRVSPPESIERTVALIDGHTGAGINHGELDFVGELTDTNQHCGSRRRMSDRVVNQVIDDLFWGIRQRGTDGKPSHLDSVMSDADKDKLGVMYPCVSRAEGAEITLDA